jgi:hypothetical protein
VKLIFSDHAWDDYLFWQKTDKKVLRRINTLIKETKQNPFEGIGKLDHLNMLFPATGPDESLMNTGSFIKYLKMQFISPSCAITTDLFL